MSVQEVGAEARTPSQLARRERIIAAATELLDERDYDRIQIRDVAEKASVALGTLYRYFPSKQQLYAEVLVHWTESFDATVRTRSQQSASDAERLRAALRRTVRAYERHPNFFRLITVLEVVADEPAADRYGDFASRYAEALGAVLLDTAEEDRPAIAYICSTVLGNLLRAWSLRGTPISQVYDRLDEVVDLIFTGPRPNT